MTPDFDACAELPNFGIFHLSVSDAAFLIATCLAFDGAVSDSTQAAFDKAAEDPNVWGGQWDAEPIRKALSKDAKSIKDQVVRSIDSGELASPVKRRNMKGELLPEQSFVSCEELEQWAQARGIVLCEPYGGFFNKETAKFESLREYAVEMAAGKIRPPSSISAPPLAPALPTQQQPVEMDPRERTTLLRIIKALALEAALPLNQPHKAAEALTALAAKHGLSFPKKAETVAKKLEQARDTD